MRNKKGTVMKCSLCHKSGHNKRTCGMRSKPKTSVKFGNNPKAGEPFLNAGRKGNLLYETIDKIFEEKKRSTNPAPSVQKKASSLDEDEMKYFLTWWNLTAEGNPYKQLKDLEDFFKGLPFEPTEELKNKMKLEVLNYAHMETVKEVIQDSEVPIDVALEMAEATGLRDELAHHQSTGVPLATLKKAMKSHDHIIRCAVARHPNTTPEMLTELYRDKHIRVRRTVIKNMKTPQNIVEFAAKNDRSREVREVAAAKLKLREKLKKQSS